MSHVLALPRRIEADAGGELERLTPVVGIRRHRRLAGLAVLAGRSSSAPT
ncbi:MAG TPA: hypothetical protein VHK22_02215 [Gaiellaceae bacterium]|nr:hypothetical protein [Gaiellaceae bacterium]